MLAGISTVRPLPPEKPAATEVEDAASVVVPMRRRRRFRIASLAAAAAVLAVIGVGAVFQPWHDTTTSNTGLSAADQRGRRADAKHVSINFNDGSSATVVRSTEQGQGGAGHA